MVSVYRFTLAGGGSRRKITAQYDQLVRVALVLVLLLILAGCSCRVITARDYRVLRVMDGDRFKVHYQETHIEGANTPNPTIGLRKRRENNAAYADGHVETHGQRGYIVWEGAHWVQYPGAPWRI